MPKTSKGLNEMSSGFRFIPPAKHLGWRTIATIVMVMAAFVVFRDLARWWMGHKIVDLSYCSQYSSYQQCTAKGITYKFRNASGKCCMSSIQLVVICSCSCKALK